jgi:copper(I)-binding protein
MPESAPACISVLDETMKLEFAAPLAALIGCLSCVPAACAAVTATEAWVRATVPGQQVAAGYVKLRSDEPAALVGVRTPAAGHAEIHEMSLQNGVMKMRPVQKIPLPAGRTVELKPGGYHLMLMELPHPLQAGDKVQLTLTVEGKSGRREDVRLEAEVRSAVPAQPGHGGHMH